MKLYLSCDIEGIWGNAAPANTMPSGRDYQEYRMNMINEVNEAIDLAFRFGADEVLVNDSHGNMDNLLASKLDPRAGIVIANGAYKAYGMMEGFDETFDAVMFIGYHCRSNSEGDLAHTIWGTMVSKIEVDGQEMGESGINAKLAYEYGVPVVLVAGDDLLKAQLDQELEGKFAFVETKKTISSQCALCCSKQELQKRYYAAFEEAMECMKTKPAKGKQAHMMDITFHHIRNASFVARMDGVERISPCCVRIQKDNYDDLYQYMRFVIKVCNAFA